MGRSILIALTALLVTPAAATACATIPAGFADDVRVGERTRYGREVDRTWTTLCVRAAGRRIVLRRARLIDRAGRRPVGAIVGGAAAAGRRVAWIETRYGRRTRTATIHIARIGRERRPRIVRRVVVSRDRSPDRPDLDVVITARGELAWLTPLRRPADWSRIVYDPPEGPPRTVGRDYASDLVIEDGLTLRWDIGGFEFGFYELPRPPTGRCPQRSRFRNVATGEEVTVTERVYEFGALQVLRACVHATGRDRVIAQANDGEGNGDSVIVAGLDRRWVAVLRYSFSRYDPCAGGFRLSTTGARTGKVGRATGFGDGCVEQPPVPLPGGALAVTTRGVAAWVVDEDGMQRLLAAGPDGGVAEIDRGTIDGLRARGTAIEWTRDGQPMTRELP